MPLMKSKSKQAFSHNVKAEMDSGKSQKQSLAIAYATKRRAKMAKGGMVEQEDSQDPENEFLTEDMESPFEHEEDANEPQEQAKVDLSGIMKRIRREKLK